MRESLSISLIVALCFLGVGCLDTLRKGLAPPPATLHEAISRKEYGYFKQLLPGHRAELNAVDRDASMLHTAALRGDADGVRVLVAAGADVNLKAGPLAWTPLHRAQTAAVVRELVKGRANLEELTGVVARTPLHFAAQSASCEVVTALLEAGANPNARDSSDGTPLMEVVTGNDTRAWSETQCVIRELAKNGADFNLRTNSNQSALSYAIRYGRDAEIAELVAAGANVNYQDADGGNGVLDDLMRNPQKRTIEQRLVTCKVLVGSGLSKDLIQSFVRHLGRSEKTAPEAPIYKYLREQIADSHDPVTLPRKVKSAN